MYLTLIFQFSVFLSALWETIHLDPPLFLYMEYFSYQNTSFIQKLRSAFLVPFLKLRKTDFTEKKPDFSIPVFYIFFNFFLHLNEIARTSNFIPIKGTLNDFLKFWYSYQRCGSRSTLIHRYSFIWNICHIKIHLLSKNGEVPFGAFFLNCEKSIFLAKIPVFSIPVHDTGSKVRNSDPQ